jgi:hypothetical protein
MQLEKNPVSFLGRKYEEVRAEIGDLEPMQRSVDGDDETWLSARPEDERWEYFLSDDGMIESIVLMGDWGCDFPDELPFGMSEAEMVQVKGEPSNSLHDHDFPGSSLPTSLLWDYPSHCVIAHLGRDDKLSRLTFKLPRKVR